MEKRPAAQEQLITKQHRCIHHRRSDSDHSTQHGMEQEEEERGRLKHKEEQVPSLGPFKPTRPVFLSFEFKNILLLRRKKYFFTCQFGMY